MPVTMLQVVNPATEQLLRELRSRWRRFDRSQSPHAARHAQPVWAQHSCLIDSRSSGVSAHRSSRTVRSLASTLTSEMGKPIRQSRNELTAMQGRIDFFLEHTERALADEVVHQSAESPGLEERIRYEPLGVIANISAWNYPYFVGSNVFLPALLAGNAVLYKPSEHATLTGLAIADLLRDAGLPPDVLQTVVGAGAARGRAARARH